MNGTILMGLLPRTKMHRPLVAVILGTRSDFNIMRRGMETLRVMGVPYIFEMASSHRSPEKLVQFVREAGERGIEVIITAAGGAANLPGFIASFTNLPVIAVPIDSTPLRGQDALYSIVQMPPGIPVATVGINNAENASLLATQILALQHERFREVLAHRRMSLGQRMESHKKELLSEYPDLCEPERTAPVRKGAEEADTDPGSEESTPTPEPEEPTNGRSERIRPGAILLQRTPLAQAGRLIQTPMPQEPSIQTADPYIQPQFSQSPPPKNRPAEVEPPDMEDLSPGSTPPEIRKAEEETPEEKAPPSPSPDEENLKEEEPSHEAPPSAEEPPPPPGESLHAVETKLFRITHEAPDLDVITHGMMVVLEGGILAMPTDTVYGLAVDAMNPMAVTQLYEVKGQNPQRKSLSVLIHTADLLDQLVREVPPALEKVLDKFWPGGLTVIFSKHPTVLSSVSESPTIAIRIPDDAVAISLMQMVQRPLAVINAALEEQEAAVTATEVIERFEGRIECVLDAGKCREGKSSTVLSVLTEPFEILREGAVPREELKRLLGDKLKD